MRFLFLVWIFRLLIEMQLFNFEASIRGLIKSIADAVTQVMITKVPPDIYCENILRNLTFLRTQASLTISIICFFRKMFRSKKTIEISHLDGVHQSTLAIKKRYLLKAISI